MGSSLAEYEKKDLDYFLKQEDEWRLSFKNLYDIFKYGSLPYFWYFNKLFGCLFRNEDGNQSATVTKATVGLKSILEQESIKYKEVGNGNEYIGYLTKILFNINCRG
jgi:hypothetical protein